MKGLKEIVGKLRLVFCPSPTVLVPYEQLKEIHERRFAGTDSGRFVRIWCELADICKVSPTELHEDNQLEELCPPFRCWKLVDESAQQEALWEFVWLESRHLPPPKSPLNTVGDVVDYLLEGSVTWRDRASPVESLMPEPSSHIAQRISRG